MYIICFFLFMWGTKFYYLQVENGWLEPLLVRIIDNPKRLVCPVIENINYQDFSLEPVSSYLRGTYYSCSKWDIQYLFIF